MTRGPQAEARGPVANCPMSELTDIQRDRLTLVVDRERLEIEYTMFFAGRTTRPRRETRGGDERVPSARSPRR